MSIAEKLTTIAENERKVFDAGKQAEYDAFWDAYQSNGKRDGYQSSFSSGWTASIFKPKHPIKLGAEPYKSKSMFFWFGDYSEEPLDWRTVADKIDLSEVTDANSMFHSARINYIDVDLSSATSLYCCFASGWQPTNRTHLTLKVSEKCKNFSDAFYDIHLTHLFFKDGSEIASNISVSRCDKLVKDSIISIFSALSESVSGTTVSLKLTAVQKAFETAEGANDGNTSEEWLALVASKQNWTITLA